MIFSLSLVTYWVDISSFFFLFQGLYTVGKLWTCKGASGLVIFKFLMIRCENQLPVPWEPDFNLSKKHSMKQLPLVADKTATEDSVSQHQYVNSFFSCLVFVQKFEEFVVGSHFQGDVITQWNCRRRID